MSSTSDIIGWFNLMGWALMFIICAVMVFRETERKPTPDDNDKAGIIIDESETGFKRADNVEKADKNEETESK